MPGLCLDLLSILCFFTTSAFIGGARGHRDHTWGGESSRTQSPATLSKGI